MKREERKKQRALEKEIELKYIALIREAFARKDKERAKNLLGELATKIKFPRLQEILKEYDEWKPGKIVWGLWGPENDLVITAKADNPEKTKLSWWKKIFNKIRN